LQIARDIAPSRKLGLAKSCARERAWADDDTIAARSYSYKGSASPALAYRSSLTLILTPIQPSSTYYQSFIYTMSGYNSNEAYGTSGTTGGLGVRLILQPFDSFDWSS